MNADKILPLLPRDVALGLRSVLASGVFLRIQNVTDYYYATGEESHSWESFHHPVPPWPNIWVEWNEPEQIFISTPNNIVGVGLVKQPSGAPRHMGALVVSSPLDAPDELLVEVHVFSAEMSGGWMTTMRQVLRRGEIEMHRMEIDAHRGMITLYEEAARENGHGHAFRPAALMSSWVAPIFLAFSFANCRNVRRVCEAVPPKLRKARERRGKPAVLRTYTLQIDPMREILDREGQRKEKGLAHALHICRGHFKSYDERPLFGRVKGRFWWPSHVRGDIKHGAVVKDYEIGPVK